MGIERRKHSRVDAKIDVQFRTGKEFIHCYAQNISKGGIYLETEALPDPNATIEIVLDFSSTPNAPQKTLTLLGRVARLMTMSVDKKTIHKVGIQFLDVPAQTQIQLDALYEQLAKN